MEQVQLQAAQLFWAQVSQNFLKKDALVEHLEDLTAEVLRQAAAGVRAGQTRVVVSLDGLMVHATVHELLLNCLYVIDEQDKRIKAMLNAVKDAKWETALPEGTNEHHVILQEQFGRWHGGVVFFKTFEFGEQKKRVTYATVSRCDQLDKFNPKTGYSIARRRMMKAWQKACKAEHPRMAMACMEGVAEVDSNGHALHTAQRLFRTV